MWLNRAHSVYPATAGWRGKGSRRATPEFDLSRCVYFWSPANHVVNFKRQVYERALRQFAPTVEVTCSVTVGTCPQQAEALRLARGGE